MKLNKYESYKWCHIPCPKNMPNLNPRDAQLRNIFLAARHPPHQSRKLLDIFSIQNIGYNSFQGSHPICFFYSRARAIGLIK